jgi:hypothetical protein
MREESVGRPGLLGRTRAPRVGGNLSRVNTNIARFHSRWRTPALLRQGPLDGTLDSFIAIPVSLSPRYILRVANPARIGLHFVKILARRTQKQPPRASRKLGADVIPAIASKNPITFEVCLVH